MKSTRWREADPQQLAIANAKAAYASYHTLGLVAMDVGDTSIDEETLVRLINDYAPMGVEAAETWISTVDPTQLAAPPVVYADYCAEEPWACPGARSCPFARVCVLTHCGTTGCGPCPDIFDLSKLAVKSWCAYTCVIGKDVVGYAFHGVSKFKLLTWEQCIPNE